MLTSLSLTYTLSVLCCAAGVFALFVGCLKWRRSRKRTQKSLTLPHMGISLTLLLGLLLVPEVLTALFYDRTDSFGKTKVSQRWAELHVNINDDGYRDDRALPKQRTDGAHYIVCAGDSFTFGHGVEATADRFSNRLERLLKAREDADYLVSNVGLPGLDIRVLNARIVPELIQTRVPVDTLIYTFVPNDIEYLDERTAAFYSELNAIDPQFPLFRETYFYNLLYYRVSGALQSGSGPGYYDYLEDSYTGAPWERLTNALAALHEQCRSAGMELKIVLFPFLHNLGDSPKLTTAYQRLGAWCDSQGIDHVDLTNVLLDHKSEGLTVNPYDAHPNPRAHELAAEAIFRAFFKESAKSARPD